MEDSGSEGLGLCMCAGQRPGWTNKQHCMYRFLPRRSSIRTTIKMGVGASLVAQWLRVRLPMQGTQVRAAVRENPTCHGAAGPVNHSC